MGGNGSVFSKTISTGLLAGLVTGDIFLSAIVALIFGIVSASHQYNTARKDDLLTFDSVDFIIAVFSSLCVGMLGYLGSGTVLGYFNIENGAITLVIVAVLAVAGFKGLTTTIDYLISKIRGSDEAKVIINNTPVDRRDQRVERPSIDETPPNDDFWDDTTKKDDAE